MTDPVQHPKPPRKGSSGEANARAIFQVTTGRSPEQVERFVQGMWEKAKSISIDPIMTIYGPGGMLNRAADKAVDKLQGIDKPDTAYVSKEEHAKYLDAIITVGGALFPGLGEGAAAGVQGRALATADGVVVPATEVAATVEKGAVAEAAKAPVLLAEGAKAGERSVPAAGGKEPGRWYNDLAGGANMNERQAAYQEQVTGRSAQQTYYVKGVSFDGFEPGRKGVQPTLVEAKDLGDSGRFVKAYENMSKGNFSDFSHLYDRATKIVEQAKTQVKAAEGTGARIEWRVSSEKGAEAVRVLFDNDPALKGKISVEHVPMKSESVPAAPKVEAPATRPPEQVQPPVRVEPRPFKPPAGP